MSTARPNTEPATTTTTAKRPPLVSVVIPTYNNPAMLLETLGTVFGQTFTDYEVVIVNDGSTDDTLERLRPLEAAGRVRVVTQANAGIGAARNRGIDEARGTYVAPLDHDDLWKPTILERQVAFMRSHPQCAACTVPWAYSPTPDVPVFRRADVCDAEGIVRRPLKHFAEGTALVITSCLMFDRARMAGIRYVEDRQCIEDLSFQIQMFGRGAFGVAADEVLMVYRLHEGNYSSNAVRYWKGVPLLRAMDRRGEFADLAGEQRRDLLEYLAHTGRTGVVFQLRTGRRGRAAALYASEFLHQARLGRVKFLGMLPVALVSPAALVRRAWPTTRLLQANRLGPGAAQRGHS